MHRWDANDPEVRSVILTTIQPEEFTTTEVVKIYHGRQTTEAAFQHVEENTPLWYSSAAEV